jgi:cytosine/adenosine deaminase-related metal-dependent hydrolase
LRRLHNGGTLPGVADLLLRDVRPWPREPGLASVDVVIRDGRIASGPAPAGMPVADGRGGVLLPAFADAHAHLDSTRLGLPFRPHTAEPGLAGLIDNDRQNWRTAGGSVEERATRTLGATIASGATTVRSHAQVDTSCGLERLEGVLAAREAHAALADVQVVAFPQSGILRDRGTADLLDAAVQAGADLVGGLDPCAFDRDPVGHLDVVFGVAQRHGIGVDIHLHETGELGAFTIELIAERAVALGMQGSVTISHAFALGTVEANRQAQLIELLAAADIALTTVAPGNREPLPLEALRAGGVRVGLGQDGIRDYWSPYGNGDVLERAWQLAFRHGFRRDDLVELCVDVASRGGRAVVGATTWSREPMAADTVTGLAPGAPADLVVVAADTVTAAVMDHPPRTLVIRGGDVIARDGQLC